MKKKDNKSSFYTKEIKKKKYVNEDYKMAVSFVIVLLVVLLLVGLLYFVNGKFITKDNFQGKTTTTTKAVSYDPSVISVSDILSVSKDKYYVMVYDTTKKNQDALYGTLVYSYSGDTKLYSVDLNLAFNTKYYNVEKEEKLNVSKYEDMNFTRPTLLVINKNKVSEAITDQNKIVEKLKEKAKK